jgi:two pore calcium channel protein 1
MRTFFDTIPILIIIGIFIVYSAIFGFVMFSDPNFNDREKSFIRLDSSIFNVYVLFTSSNFPNIIFNFWKITNFSIFYFIIVVIIGIYFLMNVMLGVIYNSYRN